jgi:NDP-sugar pyrophosphorylase family protein
MILGAGRGTRLASAAPTVPKVLVDIAGEPLLARQLRYLGGEGVTSVVVNTHHLADQVERFARDHRPPPELRLLHEDRLLGTAGGVRNALPHLQGPAVFVLYGDVLTTEPLRALLDGHSRAGARATLTVYESMDTEGKGTVEVEDGRVVAFREKQDAPAGMALINAGLYVVDAAFVADFVADGAVSDFGHDVFPAALAAGAELRVHVLAKPVLDVGTPATLEEARRRR